MTTPPPPGPPPSPAPGNPYAQPTGGQNPYAAQVPQQVNPYQAAPQQQYAAAPPVPPAPQPYPPSLQKPYGQPAAPQALQQPYGQQPYGQAPYGQAPYGQAPYGQAPNDRPPYGQQPYDQPQQQPFAPEPGAVTCRFCGGYPAVSTTVRGHRGMVVIMQFRSMRGPFCRTCGTATVRDMSAQTLWQGWWGYGSSLITPITLLRNLFAHNKIKSLPEPVPGQHGPQLDPGKPLLQRPAAIGFLVPIAAFLLVVGILVVGAAAGGGSSTSASGSGSGLSSSGDASGVKVGDCVVNAGTTANPELQVRTCGTGTFKVLAKLPGTTVDTGCPTGTTSSYSQQSLSSGSDDFVLCLQSGR